jgi:hypothetical protein
MKRLGEWAENFPEDVRKEMSMKAMTAVVTAFNHTADGVVLPDDMDPNTIDLLKLSVAGGLGVLDYPTMYRKISEMGYSMQNMGGGAGN